MNILIVNGIEYRLFNHLYAVAREGCVLRIRDQMIIQPKTRKDGYQYIASKILLHRMVATCWIERPEGADDVHHINENKADNRADNLMWLSRKAHVGMHEPPGLYERTEVTRQKLRDYRTGRKTAEETKAKQRDASLRLGVRPPARPLGFKITKEQSDAMSETHWRNTNCIVDGVTYRSFAEAGRSLGIRPLTVRKRCLSPSFPNYTVAKI